MAAKEEEQLSLFESASAKLTDAQKVMAEARDLASAKIADAQKLMAEAGALLKEDLNNARLEKEAVEEITKTLNQVHFASTIKLNIGGKIYQTTLDTLRKDPDSMLCAMFSGRFELKADEKDGAYFIDRDGKLFRYILNYLRDGELLCPDDKVKQELLKEAKFYQIQGIISHLEETVISPLEASLIIKDKNHQLTLMSWLPANATYSLLYQASTDGKTPADFHRCCDGKGPTLVVIKSGENIFGGYTSQSWESATNAKAITDNQSFLFTLVNPSGTQPDKLTPKSVGGILCLTTAGPIFGSTHHYDLQVCSPSGPVVVYVSLGHGFTCPTNVDRNRYFCAGHPSEISELEVFNVNFKIHMKFMSIKEGKLTLYGFHSRVYSSTIPYYR